MNLAIEKRVDSLSLEQIQEGNRHWWTKNPMAYDWHGEIKATRFTKEWYDAIDARSVFSSRLFATDKQPFDRIIPIERLNNQRVLEIGCGMGLHTETMVRAGAKVTAIDLSPMSIEATTKRLELKNLSAEVQEADAEHLPFSDETFDFVWSWGVIHHSSRTGRIVREIARVLNPEGEARVMVYNREGTPAQITYWYNHILRLGFLKRSYEESLFRATDGFSARYYIPDQFEDLFRTFFRDVSTIVCGLEADVIPLPRKLRRIALSFASETWLRKTQSQRGAFLFLRAQGPE